MLKVGFGHGAMYIAFASRLTGFGVLTWRGITIVKAGRMFSRIWNPVS